MDTKGNRDIQDLANKLGNVSKNTKSLAENMIFLKNTFLGYIGALGVREIARMSDEMQNLSNRLKIVSKAGEDTQQTMVNILQLANETNQSVSETAEVYVRLGSSLKAADISANSLLEITKSLVNSFRISGSTGSETAATIVQLSQAFASGTLRGQELRSVMLQNAELARLLRERFGKNLAKDAEAGLISIVEVLKLLRQNQERINEQAKILAPTFEQVLTKAFNRASFAIHNLNTEFKLSEKFAKGMDIFIEKLGLIGIIAGALALTQIPNLITAIRALSLAMFQLATKNPLIATLLALSAIIIATNSNVEEFTDKFRNLGAWLVQIAIWANEAALSVSKMLNVLRPASLKNNDTDLVDRIERLKESAEKLATPTVVGKGTVLQDDKQKSDAEFNALIERLQTMYGQTEKAQKIKEILGQINKEFLAGSITIGQYNTKLVDFELYKVNREFREGKFDVFAYTERMRALKEQDFNRQFREGRLTLLQYNAALESIRLEELKQKFDAGKVSAAEYNAELVKIAQKFEPGGSIMAGTQAYIESIGTVSSNVADAIKNTFTALETEFLAFIKTGKFNFASFTQGILDDLAKIIVRASIVKPLADAILSSGFSSSGSTGSVGGGGGQYPSPNLNAMGNVYDRGLKKFAKGGVVSSATMFGYGKGQMGVMGEAGPEAILPLQRGSGGNLGVAATVTPVTINIVNQSGAEVEQSETTGPNGEKQIEILIQRKVSEGFATGKFDKVMRQSYGVGRKGS